MNFERKMPKTRFQIAKSDIVDAVDALSNNVFTSSQLAQLLDDNRDSWRLSKDTTVTKFINELRQSAQLKKVELDFPNRKEIRYVWREATTYQLLMTLPGNPYFTHYAAMSLHQLTEQIPKIIYVNCEGRPLPRATGGLEQHRIDLAFRGKGRPSSNITTVRDQSVCILNGKHTEQLGVVDGLGSSGERIRLSNVERTLIDSTVRPMYSGGVGEVLKAFRMAKEKDVISVNKLAATLTKLDYIYPYHQAIGFYMERAGVYADSALDIIKQFEKRFDFYLTYQMKDPEYSKHWRLFYPKGF